MTGVPAQPRRPLIAAAWVGSIVIAAGLSWWGAVQATNPPQVEIPEQATTSIEVVDGTVAVEQAYGVDAEWPADPVGVNSAAGSLTSLALASTGTPVNAGDVIYTVDLAPIVALTGAVPAFRDLTPGTEGPDVTQLQDFLVAAGYLSGNPDGRFGASTARAADAWSAALGQPRTGMVPASRIVFVPELPAVLAPSPDIRVGMRVSPGEPLLVGAAAGPSFSIRVLPEAVAQITEGLEVVIDANGAQWRAEVDRLATSNDDLGGTIAILRPIDGAASICGEQCGTALAVGETSVLPGVLVLVPPASGPQVPTAAIATNASGDTQVTMAGGTRRAVEVLASADGRSIVEGVEVGERVLVGDAAASK